MGWILDKARIFGSPHRVMRVFLGGSSVLHSANSGKFRLHYLRRCLITYNKQACCDFLGTGWAHGDTELQSPMCSRLVRP